MSDDDYFEVGKLYRYKGSVAGSSCAGGIDMYLGNNKWYGCYCPSMERCSSATCLHQIHPAHREPETYEEL